MHGFDEFFGNLYHLNAEEEPENPDYPKDPEFRKRFGPRGVLKCKATDKDDRPSTAVRQGRQADDREHRPARPASGWRRSTRNSSAAALDFMERKTKEGKPWFCYFNSTRMHVFTHLKPESEGKTGLGLYPDGMVELDGYVGQLLKKLDDLGVADNTIVVFTTDNGAEVMSWPDGGAPRSAARRTPTGRAAGACRACIRWPGVIKPGTRHQRHLLATGLHPDVRGRGRRARPGRQGEEGLQDGRQDLQGPPRRLQPDARSSRARRRSRRGRASSTGATTATCWPFAFSSGRSCFKEQLPRGPGRLADASSRTCAHRRSSTSASDPFERGDESILYDKWMADACSSSCRRRPLSPVARQLQGIPAPPEAGELQPRQGDRPDVEGDTTGGVTAGASSTR